MSATPTVVNPGTTVYEAKSIMAELGVRTLPVVLGESIVGVVSDRDLREFSPSRASCLLSPELHYPIDSLVMGEVMTHPVLTVSPNDTLLKATELLRQRGYGALPVVEGDKLVGMLTVNDVLGALLECLIR